MNFSNKAAIATLKLINDRMDYLSNDIGVDRTYDELVELNELGEMRQQLERETFIDYYVQGELKTDSVDNIKLNGERRVNPFKGSEWADPIAANATRRMIRLALTTSGLIDYKTADKYATLVTESVHPQIIKAA